MLLLCGAAEAVFAAPDSIPAYTKVQKQSTLTEDQKISLALNRLAFGPRPGEIDQVRAMGLSNWIDQQLHPETIDDSAVDAEVARLEDLNMSGTDLMAAYKEDRERQKARQEALKLLKTADAASAAGAQTQTVGTQTQTAAAPQATMAPITGQSLLQLQAGSNVVAPDIPPNAFLRRGAGPGAGVGLGVGAGADIQTANEPMMQPGTSVEALGELASSKVLRSIDSNRQLQEVLVDFWSNHFNLDVNKGPVQDLIVADQRDVIRAHVFGKFRDLLEASAKSPAMLWYLDNYQSTRTFTAPVRYRNVRTVQYVNGVPQYTRVLLPSGNPTAPAKGRKTGLNENYGRELMELHTLGVDGGYTQEDVTEVARCFTGWSIDQQTGEFRFYPNRHDDGQKVVLGHLIPAGGGIQDGETVLDILASSPSCAHFISKELCVRLVSDTPPESLVKRAAETFTRTQGDLREVVRTIVTSPEFYSPAVYRAKIKSPFEYAVSAVRAVDGHYEAPDPDNLGGRAALTGDGGVSMRRRPNRYSGRNAPSIIHEIADLGEPMFSYEFPTGYPEISSKWVSAGGLLARFNYATALGSGQVTEVSASPSDLLAGIPLTDHMAVLHKLVGDILNGDISDSTRKALIAEMPATGPVDPMQLVSLLIGSPEFQRR